LLADVPVPFFLLKPYTFTVWCDLDIRSYPFTVPLKNPQLRHLSPFFSSFLPPSSAKLIFDDDGARPFDFYEILDRRVVRFPSLSSPEGSRDNVDRRFFLSRALSAATYSPKKISSLLSSVVERGS